MGNMKKFDIEKRSMDVSYDEPPPSYEEAAESIDSTHTQPAEGSSTVRRLLRGLFSGQSRPASGSDSRTTATTFTKQATPLQIVPLSPEAIKCRCGRHNDTTVSTKTLPGGCVTCICGYLVYSDGSSHQGPTVRTTPTAVSGTEPQPLQLVSSHPASIKCRCGKRNDTTRRSGDLPAGCVRCRCGYLVYSDGSSHYEASQMVCPRKKCRREIKRPWPGLCSCGVRVNIDGSVHINDKVSDPKRVECLCGAFNDTTQQVTIKHCEGLTCYEYELPKGSARCSCGRTVRRDGSSLQEHPASCCKKKKPAK